MTPFTLEVVRAHGALRPRQRLLVWVGGGIVREEDGTFTQTFSGFGVGEFDEQGGPQDVLLSRAGGEYFAWRIGVAEPPEDFSPFERVPSCHYTGNWNLGACGVWPTGYPSYDAHPTFYLGQSAWDWALRDTLLSKLKIAAALWNAAGNQAPDSIYAPGFYTTALGIVIQDDAAYDVSSTNFVKNGYVVEDVGEYGPLGETTVRYKSNMPHVFSGLLLYCSGDQKAFFRKKELTGAVVVLNGHDAIVWNNKEQGGPSLQAIVLHEMGHTLGLNERLGKCGEESLAVMKSEISNVLTWYKHHLSFDDVKRVKTLYNKGPTFNGSSVSWYDTVFEGTYCNSPSITFNEECAFPGQFPPSGKEGGPFLSG